MNTKDLSLAKRIYMVCSFFTSGIFSNCRPLLADISDVRDGKFYQLLPDKENTVSHHCFPTITGVLGLFGKS